VQRTFDHCHALGETHELEQRFFIGSASSHRRQRARKIGQVERVLLHVECKLFARERALSQFLIERVPDDCLVDVGD
jgi:hypothetical protein